MIVWTEFDGQCWERFIAADVSRGGRMPFDELQVDLISSVVVVP